MKESLLPPIVRKFLAGAWDLWSKAPRIVQVVIGSIALLFLSSPAITILNWMEISFGQVLTFLLWVVLFVAVFNGGRVRTILSGGWRRFRAWSGKSRLWKWLTSRLQKRENPSRLALLGEWFARHHEAVVKLTISIGVAAILTFVFLSFGWWTRIIGGAVAGVGAWVFLRTRGEKAIDWAISFVAFALLSFLFLGFELKFRWMAMLVAVVITLSVLAKKRWPTMSRFVLLRLLPVMVAVIYLPILLTIDVIDVKIVKVDPKSSDNIVTVREHLNGQFVGDTEALQNVDVDRLDKFGSDELQGEFQELEGKEKLVRLVVFGKRWERAEYFRKIWFVWGEPFDEPVLKESPR